ncbi:hypothetical protein G7046_g5877 [Stylonectria norvegica]|nr:hypothetical protein G7046_g5877 [Stylonectria norvegica]
MDKLLNKLVSSGGGFQQPVANLSLQTYTIRPSPQDGKLQLVHTTGSPVGDPPLYCIAVSDKRPNIVFYRGIPGPSNAIAHGDLHLLSSSTSTLSLRGQTFAMKMSQLSESISFEYQQMGRLKWKPSAMTGTSLELYDKSGLKLAKFGSSGILKFGEKKLEMFVPCDGQFVELVVFSALAARELKKASDEVASEVIQAVAGV